MRLKMFLATLLVGVAFFMSAFAPSSSAQSAPTEGFEGFSSSPKFSYASAPVTLSTGVWNLDEALIGGDASDRRTGTFAVRVRNTGRVTMQFDRAGVGTLTIQHAIYGTDAAASWELWYSTNGGGAWTKFGSTVNTTSTALQTATFAVNTSATIRFEIRKISGTGRLNFDNIAFGAPVAPPPPTSTSVHLTMGNPSGATVSTSNPNNYLMEKQRFALSYNRSKGTANWVSWQLASEWLGSQPRTDAFAADTTLPAGWYRVQALDYPLAFNGVAIDRGHMCPSADRTRTVQDNTETFLMTNMIPQTERNNQGPWADFESFTRSLLNNTTNEIYVVCGPAGSQGTIVNGNVTVPTQTWKVVLVLPKGSDDAVRVSSNPNIAYTIAVVMPNDGQLSLRWQDHIRTVDEVESLTGFNFFSNLSTTAQSQLEARRYVAP
jgi:endonuclease G